LIIWRIKSSKEIYSIFKNNKKPTTEIVQVAGFLIDEKALKTT